MTKRRPEPDTHSRTLPHNLEAEKAVLGALLINSDLLPRVQAVVTTTDFFRDAHQRIFAAMGRLEAKKSAVDMMTLRAELKRGGELDEVGGAAYISALTDGVPRSANANHYAKIVKSTARLRGVIRVANTALADAYEAERSADDILREADKALLELQRGGAAHNGMVDTRLSSMTVLDDLDKRSKNPFALLGIDTGFPTVNDMTLGWQRGDLNIIAARPSIGKTAFTLNTAEAAATNGVVAIFSLEMKLKQLEYRRLAHLAGIDCMSLKRGTLGEDDYPKITKALSQISAARLFIDDRGARTWQDIRSACRRLRADEGQLDLVVVDYVQLMRGEQKLNRTQQLDEIAMALKNEVAGDLDTPVLMLSQLSRAGRDRADSRPQLSDLRDSGALEQHADSVLFLHRKHHRESGITNLIVEKQRNGDGGTVNLTFSRETQTFRDAGLEPEQPALPDPPPEEEPKARGRRRPPVGWRRG